MATVHIFDLVSLKYCYSEKIAHKFSEETERLFLISVTNNNKIQHE